MFKNSTIPLSRHKKQGGWLSIELFGVLIVLAVAGSAFSDYYVTYQSNAKAAVIGAHLERITRATEAYAKANWQSLKSDAAGGSATVDFAELEDGGYLQADTSEFNAIGQEYTIQAVPAPADTLTIMIVGEGGQITSNGELTGGDLNLVTQIIPNAARQSGITAGYIPYQRLPNTQPLLVEGPEGTWTYDLSTEPTLAGLDVYQGSLVSIVHMESGQLNNDYLYRSDVGVPELNRMETTLDMHGNNIIDAGTILARDVIIDDVRVDGVLPASVSRGVYTMTRLAPGGTIAKPDCRAPSSYPSVFVAVDSSPVGGSEDRGLNIKTTSGSITGQVMSVRTRAPSIGSAYRVEMDVYMAGGTAGSGRWYTLLPPNSSAQYEASMIVSTKCS